jgi:hypothetical protein
MTRQNNWLVAVVGSGDIGGQDPLVDIALDLSGGQ